MTSGCRVTSTQPAMPGSRRDARADEAARALAGHRLEHELVALLVEQEDRRGARAEDRARHLDDRLQQRAVLALGIEHAGGAAAATARPHDSSAAPHVGRGQVEDALDLERLELGMLAEHERAEPGHVRRGEAVAGQRIVAPPEPGDLARRRRARRTRPADRGSRRRRTGRRARGSRPRSPKRSATGSSPPACCAREATSSVRRKYAESARSCSTRPNSGFDVERLMLITSKPCSIA